MSIGRVATPTLLGTIRTPADTLATLAAKKALDAQKAAAAAEIALLDPNARRLLNVPA